MQSLMETVNVGGGGVTDTNTIPLTYISIQNKETGDTELPVYPGGLDSLTKFKMVAMHNAIYLRLPDWVILK
jgi:hypothetical protein